jgi:hypothetical protein
VGFERNYRANIPSKQFNIRKLSTFKHTHKNPWVVTGLIDSEGSFSIILDKNKNKIRNNSILSSSQGIGKENDFFEWLCGLVVFGSNLSSTVGKQLTRTQLATVVLANHTRDIIVGLLLSDG